ncbi:VOC family protein [Haloechinothrix sp. LS1_15]|uniref:VOC family protein n=1 Tax=Haloechinothrix sp. LS1_15 TaxID=2652248 RepID=UPI002947B548|nr:VOC family protein [Haloechinothrix sp. LS1_15]MDV6014640.1 bleomycin resistance protein [Haloechinothrix sp. LS1_15]
MLSLDNVTLGVPDVPDAHEFYTSVLSPTATGGGQFVQLDMHGTGQLSLHGIEELTSDAGADPATSGFRGYIVSYVVSQPSEVASLVDAASRNGAKVHKPAKKALFGAFSGVFQAPDGAVWKVAAPTKKDTGPAGDPPLPTETGIILGVSDPKVSRAFYVALGMTVDRDYGTSYIDFHPNPGTCRFCLMPRKDLAKDVGIDRDGAGSSAMVLDRRAGSRHEVDARLAEAVAAGGQVAVAAAETSGGDYVGYFTDPDGFLWKVSSA